MDRALDLLECLAAAPAPLGIVEIAELTGLPQGTAHRLLQTLQRRGYVRRGEGRKYSVGSSAVRLSDAAVRSLARCAPPYLAELVTLTGETANLAVLEGDEVVYVAQISSPRTLRMFAEVGRHVQPHSTAVGKVLLVGLPRDQALAVVGRTGLPARTPATITGLDAFARELDLVAEQGWAADDEEQETGIRCVAVPVSVDGLVLAALSVSGPADRFAGGRDDALVTAMKRVSRALAVG